MNKRKSLQTALDYLDKGDWQSAHQIVQSDKSPVGCWVHGVVHVMEGDLANARYWYDRATRAFSEDVATEIAAVRKSLTQANLSN